MTVDWPTEAREAAFTAGMAAAIAPAGETATFHEVIDAVLAALAPHVQPRTDDWEWAVRDRSGAVFTMSDEAKARQYPAPTWVVVCRRPHAEWEVAL